MARRAKVCTNEQFGEVSRTFYSGAFDRTGFKDKGGLQGFTSNGMRQNELARMGFFSALLGCPEPVWTLQGAVEFKSKAITGIP